MADKILLFIPAYNCEKQIRRVINKIDRNIAKYIDTLLIVNNRSTDSTEQAASEMIADLDSINAMIMRNKDNYGLGGSHKVAFTYAIEHNFTHVIVLHGDDQGDINDLIPYLERGEHRDFDCLLGARFHRQSRLVGYSGFRVFGNRVYNIIFSVLLGNVIHDLGAGLNIYDTSMLRDNFYIKFPDDLTFNYCMIMAAKYYKHNTRFFPISWREEDQVSNVKMANQAIKVMKMLFAFMFGKKTFITSDLRTRVISNYDSDIVASNG